MLRGVKPTVKALIENAQPFKTMVQAPKFAALYLLHDLWNIDKHRELATVAASVHVTLIHHEGPKEGPELVVDDWGRGLTLQEGTRVMAFSVIGPRADQMKVNPQLSFEVRAEGRSLVATLTRVADVAQRLVMECEAGVPLPPLMPSALLDWPAMSMISY